MDTYLILLGISLFMLVLILDTENNKAMFPLKMIVSLSMFVSLLGFLVSIITRTIILDNIMLDIFTMITIVYLILILYISYDYLQE